MAKAILPTDAAVLYLRMSSAKQDKSIPAQRDELLKLAERKGYTIRREYLDSAISGDDTEKRDGFLRLRQDCENGPDFSIILVWHEDRFSRNDPLELGWWLKPIRDSGVVLETPTGIVDWESLGGRLIYLIGQEMRHDFLRQLSRNVARGELAAAKAGRGGTGGRAPAGYKQNGDEVLVDPEAAAIIRRVFEEYLKPGASLRQVFKRLNSEEVLSARGMKNAWTSTRVRDILTNQKYCGDFIRFKYQTGKYHSIKDGEIVPRRKTDKYQEIVEPMVVEDHHEAIVPRKLFDRVQAKLARQRKRTAHRTGHQYIFSGLLRCHDCGSLLGGTTARDRSRKPYFAYHCSTYHALGAAGCHHNEIRETDLLDVVVRKIQQHCLADQAIDRLLVAYRKRLAARRNVVPADGGRLRKQIEVLDRQIDQGAERVLSAPEKLVGTMYAKLDRLREDRDRLQAELHAAGKPETGSSAMDDKKVEEAARVLRDLREAFTDAKPEEIRELISPLVEKIELHYRHEPISGSKRERNLFDCGTIEVRPTDPGLSLLFGTPGRSGPCSCRTGGRCGLCGWRCQSSRAKPRPSVQTSSGWRRRRPRQCSW